MPANRANQAPRVDPERADEIVAPAERPGAARREDIAAVQTAETLASLREVSADQLLVEGEDKETSPAFDNSITLQ